MLHQMNQRILFQGWFVGSFNVLWSEWSLISDLWSLILIRLIPVERSSQGNVAVGFYRDVLAPFSLQFLTHVSMTVSVYWNTFCAAGPPESLAVTPNDSEVTIENNSALQLQVQVQDKAGNLTVQPRLNVVCKVTMLMFTPLWFN